jgi:hypothetical protein
MATITIDIQGHFWIKSADLAMKPGERFFI